MIILKVYIIILAFFYTACGSMTVQVDSNPPEAEVYLKTDKQFKILGKTPLEVDPKNISEKNTLLISKKGYLSQLVYLEGTTLPAQSKVSVKLQKVLKENVHLQDPSVQKSIRTISRKISLIQSQLLRKNLEEAETQSRNLLNEYPELSVGWNLLANSYYLQGKVNKAYETYEKALELDPKNPETLDILRKLKRLPSATEER